MARGKSSIRKIADYFATAVFLLIVAVAAAFFSNSGGQDLYGPFLVLDGDSLQSGEARFRLEGIDAPEGRQTCGAGDKIWACGREATRFLRGKMSKGGAVCRDVGTDRYGRTLVRCEIGDSDINADMVRNGWAVSFGAYYSEEKLARNEKAGIWAGDFVMPQQWREIHGSAEESQLGEAINNWFGRVKGWFGQMISADEVGRAQ